MKATLSFNLPEEQEEFNLVVKGGAYAAALHDVSQDVFRPARKHGYSNPEIQLLINKLNSLVPEGDDQDATELVGLLEKEFYAILTNWEIQL